jgi:carbon-monoxide dehydrogenase small subunit
MRSRRTDGDRHIVAEISAAALLRRTPAPSADEVRVALSGNLCRCTGYDGIVKAVLAVAGG